MNAHIYIFLSIFLGVISQLIIKWKMSGFDLDHYESYYDKFIFSLSMLLNPYIIISLILTLLAGLSWMLAMTKFDISYAYPFTMISFVLILIFSSLFFNEPVTWQKLVGLFLITVGILISSESL
ncbi:MAG: EamA family transporter [Bacteroidales bacterium]|nr:EamA family transporter [Bacteroidales bacterium]